MTYDTWRRDGFYASRKDFVDDEVLDRGRDTERDLRRAGRNLTDSDDDDRRSSRRARRESARDDRDVRRRSRRGDGSATNLLSDITDSAKDLVDDEIIDRGQAPSATCAGPAGTGRIPTTTAAAAQVEVQVAAPTAVPAAAMTTSTSFGTRSVP